MNRGRIGSVITVHIWRGALKTIDEWTDEELKTYRDAWVYKCAICNGDYATCGHIGYQHICDDEGVCLEIEDRIMKKLLGIEDED